jgi:acetyl esterase/lipase
MILAGVGGVLAVVFVFRGDYETAFVAAAAGAVCWILNYRQQLRATLPAQDEEEYQEDEDEEASS